MAYHLRKKETVKAGIVRVARSQIDAAIEEIDDDGRDRHEVVHQVRKRCKKMRGLVRLIRPVFPDYRKENIFFRAAAAELSSMRDAQSVVECFDNLVEHFPERADAGDFARIRHDLVDRRAEHADSAGELEQKLKTFRAQMVQARCRVKTWRITDEGFAAIAGGLMKTYGRGRKAFARAYEKPSVDSFHEWRKRVKYHWYHCRLLRETWPKMLKVHRQTADDLADLLGDDHDLAVLRHTLESEPQRFGRGEDLAWLFVLIEQRRVALQHEAQTVGEKLYAEKKKHLARRFGVYWLSWRR